MGYTLRGIRLLLQEMHESCSGGKQDLHCVVRYCMRSLCREENTETKTKTKTQAEAQAEEMCSVRANHPTRRRGTRWPDRLQAGVANLHAAVQMRLRLWFRHRSHFAWSSVALVNSLGTVYWAATMP